MTLFRPKVRDSIMTDNKNTKGAIGIVNWRRIDNTMVKTNSTKEQLTIYKTGSELVWFGRISISCSTSGTCGVILVTNPAISREYRQDHEVLTTSGTNPWSFVTQIFHSEQLSHGDDRQTFEVMTSTCLKLTKQHTMHSYITEKTTGYRY